MQKELGASSTWGMGADVTAYSTVTDYAGVEDSNYIDLSLDEVDDFIIKILTARKQSDEIDRSYHNYLKLDLFELWLKAEKITVRYHAGVWEVYRDDTTKQVYPTLNAFMDQFILETKQEG